MLYDCSFLYNNCSDCLHKIKNYLSGFYAISQSIMGLSVIKCKR